MAGNPDHTLRNFAFLVAVAVIGGLTVLAVWSQIGSETDDDRGGGSPTLPNGTAVLHSTEPTRVVMPRTTSARSSTTLSSPTPESSAVSATPAPPRTTTSTPPRPPEVNALLYDDAIDSDCSSREIYDDFEQASINGVPFRSGLFVFGTADGRDDCFFDYNLGRSWAILHAVVGVDDDSNASLRCLIEILVDGQSRFVRELGLGERHVVNLDLRQALRVRVLIKFLGDKQGDYEQGVCALGDLSAIRPSG